MKTLIASAALVASIVAANAAPAPLVNSVENSLGSYMDLDVNALSDAQISALFLIVNSSDSEGEKRAQIASLIR